MLFEVEGAADADNRAATGQTQHNEGEILMEARTIQAKQSSERG
jgi:hypothetical protein